MCKDCTFMCTGSSGKKPGAATFEKDGGPLAGEWLD